MTGRFVEVEELAQSEADASMASRTWKWVVQGETRGTVCVTVKQCERPDGLGCNIKVRGDVPELAVKAVVEAFRETIHALDGTTGDTKLTPHAAEEVN